MHYVCSVVINVSIWDVTSVGRNCSKVVLNLLGVAGDSVVVPLLFITAIFARVCSGIFKRPFEVMSLRNAVDLDKHDQVRS